LVGTRKIPVPSKKELKKFYPRLNIDDCAAEFGIGPTLFHKWLKYRNIPRTRKPRAPRSAAHKAAISKSQHGKTRPKSGAFLKCPACGKNFYRQPSLIRKTNYCSNECKGKARRLPKTQKACPECGVNFARRKDETAQNWRRRKYCDQVCAKAAHPPPILKGEENPNWKGEEARRRNRRGPIRNFISGVLKRDNATCQSCGTKEGVLNVHHEKSWSEYPELRFEISNGITLCTPCHFKIHGYNLNTSEIVEIEDERGVKSRKWTGKCLACGEFIVKRASDMRREDGTIRNYGFCSKKCSHFLKGRLKLGKPRQIDLISLLTDYAKHAGNDPSIEKTMEIGSEIESTARNMIKAGAPVTQIMRDLHITHHALCKIMRS